MQELAKIFLGVGILLLGIFLGDYLAQKTKEELKAGQKWFKSIIIISLVFSVISLTIKNDFLFFSSLFIAVVTSRSLKQRR